MQTLVKNLNLIWRIYDYKMKCIFFVIFFLMIINAFCEFFAVISIKPFLTNILRISNNNSENNISFFHNYQENILLISITLIISLFLIFSLRVLNLWLISRFSAKTGTLVATKIFTHNLLPKYYNFGNFESSYILSSLTNQMSKTVTGLVNLFRFSSSSITCFFILVALLLNDFRLNFLITFFFSAIYLLTYSLVKNRLKINSFIMKEKSEESINVIKDGIGGNKEIIANNLQFYFQNLFINSDLQGRKARWDNYVLKSLPRSIIEFFTFGVIIMLTLLSSYESNSLKIFSYIGSLAFAIQRLMPQTQTLLTTWSYVTGEKASITNILNLLKKVNIHHNISNSKLTLNFKKIVLEKVYFGYKSRKGGTLIDINLTINEGEKIGIIGDSGSGKSTLLDLISGLIVPDQGRILINNKNLHKKNQKDFLYRWRNSFSILTQRPYFIDGSILENIAFGETRNIINYKNVYESAKKAKILDYIENLPDKFNTKIGELGSKLSGGQAQRIGLARAFYKNKKFLILDEPTSSLDEMTEKLVIESIKEHCSNITLIIISHRKPILNICTKVLNLNNGLK